jgi:hypothetical protein
MKQNLEVIKQFILNANKNIDLEWKAYLKILENITKYENIMQENGKVIVSYQNQIQRRNIQINNLKAKQQAILEYLRNKTPLNGSYILSLRKELNIR